eukprot:scaffold35548_cov32-Tisochrysis_lutea.AAC.1
MVKDEERRYLGSKQHGTLDANSPQILWPKIPICSHSVSSGRVMHIHIPCLGFETEEWKAPEERGRMGKGRGPKKSLMDRLSFILEGGDG